MFDRFTNSAREVVVLTQEEARMLRDDRIGTEHLLLGLLRADPPTAAPVARTAMPHARHCWHTASTSPA